MGSYKKAHAELCRFSKVRRVSPVAVILYMLGR